ncbi:LemA family protein [Nonlabens arenilitoris]|uniref:LemA family protein n=1 Tax=Nonlabens arenilitoris TaxID=1217969 RepID=A0A2S7UBH8_9FLAO|nr:MULTISPECIES: LemA family protein [Nonlabens]PQJ32276.1 LemA family protein [Nonlabens arenilitoris]GAK93291.1 LemA family protein [Nonlabens ulvanivorans]
MSKAKFAGLGCAGLGLIGVAVIAVIIAINAYSWYNSAIGLKENVQAQWANVESSYQRRADLIPNIVATAKKYAEFEQETLTQVIEARAKATSINVDASNLTSEQIQEFSQAQGAVSSGLGRLLATYENYPDLKANENFLELINELERTENRINTERNRYNGDVKAYNAHIGMIPGRFYASWFGFTGSPYFQAEAGSETAPVVEDLFN